MTEMGVTISGCGGHRPQKQRVWGNHQMTFLRGFHMGRLLNAGGDDISPRAPHWLVCELGGGQSS